MSLSLKITSYQRLTPSQPSVYEATTDSFSIGRNADNDWAIPDPQRFLSGKHCRIHKEGDRYFITDTSTNGVFLNGAEQRLERDQSIELNHGDKFRIGDYELEVLIEDDSMTGNPFTSDDETMIDADPFDDPFASPEPELEAKPYSTDDGFEDDDPFADSNDFDTGSPDDEDFLEEAETPLSHMEDSPLGKPVSIDSLMGFDDDDDDGQEYSESIDDLEKRRSPMNESFKSSSIRQEPDIEPDPAPPPAETAGEPSGEIDEIPDNWDEATGMFVLPDKTDPFEAADPMDDFPDDWDLTPKPEQTKESSSPAVPSPPSAAEEKPAKIPSSPPEPVAEPPQAPRQATQHQSAPSAADGDAVAAFARGAQLEISQLSGIDQDVLFEQVGRMLNQFTEGLIQTLSGRTHIKSEFRLDQTMIRPADNNPFKFSTSKTRTLMQLLSKSDPAYKSGIKAISEGFDDVNAHQMAVIAGMEAALQDILARFNPNALETRMVSASILDNILPGGKKAKYWDIFKLLFDEIAGEAEDNFQQLFGKEFTRAYEEQLDRLKNIRKES